MISGMEIIGSEIASLMSHVVPDVALVPPNDLGDGKHWARACPGLLDAQRGVRLGPSLAQRCRTWERLGASLGRMLL